MSYSLPSTPDLRTEGALRVEQRLLAIGALADITLSEALSAWVDYRLGMILYGLLLVALFWSAAFTGQERVRRLCLAMALVPLMRVLGMAIPLHKLQPADEYAAVAIPLYLGAVLVMVRSRLPLSTAGLSLGRGGEAFRWFPIAALSGVLFGLAESSILQHVPVAFPAPSAGHGILLTTVMLVLGVGLLEELLYRGIILGTSRDLFGDRRSILYVAVLAAVLQIGYRSLPQVALVFLMSLWFGLATVRTRSIYPAVLGHSVAALLVYLIIPLSLFH